MGQENLNKGLTRYTGGFAFKERITGRLFEGLLFDRTDFNHAIFKDCLFRGCTFLGCQVSDVRLYGALSFEGCTFDRMRLGNDSSWGEHSGKYEDCRFERCTLRNKAMWDPRYIRRVFAHCTWANVSFNRSSFTRCAFVGPLRDVTFNGVFESRLPQDLELEIDFSEATWGDYVGFHGCTYTELSRCIAPRGRSFEELLRCELREGVPILSTFDGSSCRG